MATKTLQKKSDADMASVVKRFFPNVTAVRLTPEGSVVVDSTEELRPEELADIQEIVTSRHSREWV